jgi:23S rRNA (pseudouridine1915-N3)-methyltransferase
MKIRFLWVGKTKNVSVKSMVSDYVARIRHMMPCEVVETSDPAKKKSLKAQALIEAEAEAISRRLTPDCRVVALDEGGRQFSSAAFSSWLEEEMNRGCRSIAFVLGGPDGISSRITQNADMVLSMGKMTWTHEMCRVLLLEQVYRALCILRGFPYHRA